MYARMHDKTPVRSEFCSHPLSALISRGICLIKRNQLEGNNIELDAFHGLAMGCLILIGISRLLPRSPASASEAEEHWNQISCWWHRFFSTYYQRPRCFAERMAQAVRHIKTARAIFKHVKTHAGLRKPLLPCMPLLVLCFVCFPAPRHSVASASTKQVMQALI